MVMRLPVCLGRSVVHGSKEPLLVDCGARDTPASRSHCIVPDSPFTCFHQFMCLRVTIAPEGFRAKSPDMEAGSSSGRPTTTGPPRRSG